MFFFFVKFNTVTDFFFTLTSPLHCNYTVHLKIINHCHKCNLCITQIIQSVKIETVNMVYLLYSVTLVVTDTFSTLYVRCM